MYVTRRCTHGVPTVYPYPPYPWLTEPEGRQVRVFTGTGTGQPGITQGLPVLIPTDAAFMDTNPGKSKTIFLTSSSHQTQMREAAVSAGQAWTTSSGYEG